MIVKNDTVFGFSWMRNKNDKSCTDVSWLINPVSNWYVKESWTEKEIPEEKGGGTWNMHAFPLIMIYV